MAQLGPVTYITQTGTYNPPLDIPGKSASITSGGFTILIQNQIIQPNTNNAVILLDPPTATPVINAVAQFGSSTAAQASVAFDSDELMPQPGVVTSNFFGVQHIAAHNTTLSIVSTFPASFCTVSALVQSGAGGGPITIAFYDTDYASQGDQQLLVFQTVVAGGNYVYAFGPNTIGMDATGAAPYRTIHLPQNLGYAITGLAGGFVVYLNIRLYP